MSEVWSAEKDDLGGIYVFDASDMRADDRLREFSSEREAIEYAIDCAEDRRHALARSLRTLRSRLRTIKRRKT